MKTLKYIVLFLLSTISSNSKAQSLGKHASDLLWKSIETENVKVIFPEGTNIEAQRIADVIEFIHNNKTVSVGSKSKKIDLVLQNQQTISNGFVTLSPYRSEFFAISPQDQSSLGTTDWLDLLSMHEYRHALQYTNANRGLTKFLHIVAGQNGWSASMGLSIPSWYLEGDAVLIETLLSENGRGRNPYFFKEQRALFLDSQIYSYHKAQNGSYKDIVPNIYSLGFMINNHIRNNYAIETGSKILADAGRYKYGLYPFSSAMKKHTGLNTTKIYKKSAFELQTKFKEEAVHLKLTQSELITKRKTKTVTHYTFPQYLNEGSIIAIKRSYKETPCLVIIENGIEEKLTTVGITAQEFLSVTNDKITWTEHQKDLRHANKNYSNIITYDLKKNTKKQLTTKKRYLSPNYSFDGDKIIVVTYKENIKYSLDILDSKTGAILENIPNPTNFFLSTPKWTKNDNSIIYLAKKKSKLAFFKYCIKTKSTQQISDWTANTIGQFSVSDNTIYFTASFSGIDNIYSIDLNGNKNLKQISSVNVGAYFPSVSKNEDKIVFSEFTKKGYKIHEQQLKENIKLYATPNLEKVNYFNIKTTNIEHAILDSIPTNKYKISDYKGFLKGTKLHSWGITTSTTSTSTYGANVQFQNVLNDFNANVAILHNLNENTNSLRTHIGYGKGFLSWNLKAATQNRSTFAVLDNWLYVTSFSETFYGAGFSIPLSQYKGNYSRSFNFETNYIQHITSNNNIGNDLNFGAIESGITISNIRRTALQNVAPRFGQYLKVNYSKSIDGATAEKVAMNTIFYFPGIFKNHSLNIVVNWQKELLSNAYQYSDGFSYSRGYNNLFNEEVTKLSFNYELPILYPEFGLWGLTYFKRIRLNAFYDASILEINSADIDQNSYGGELIFDNIYFNVAPISLGLRQSFLLNTDLNKPSKKSAFDLFIRIGF
jgi:hypothetical protein